MNRRTNGIALKTRLALDLDRGYRKTQTALHELTLLFWECTLRCNLKCLHCGSDCSSRAEEDMPLARFLRVLDSMKGRVRPEKTAIALTGGEPTLRADLESCGREIAGRGFAWGMVTNGHALDEKRLASLMACGLGSLTVSLDGLEESHNWLRGDGRSFREAVRAIRAAVAARLAFDVVTCVNQRNIDELGEVKDLLVAAGVGHWRIATIFPRGRAAGNRDLDVTPAQLRRVLDFIRNVRREKKIAAEFSCEGFIGEYEGEARDDLFFCRAGIKVGSVLNDGSISACPSLRGDYIQGHIDRDDFMEVWEHRFQKMRDRSWTAVGPCAACRSYRWCEGNGLHLRDEKTGRLFRCHEKMIREAAGDSA